MKKYVYSNMWRNAKFRLIRCKERFLEKSSRFAFTSKQRACNERSYRVEEWNSRISSVNHGMTLNQYLENKYRAGTIPSLVRLLESEEKDDDGKDTEIHIQLLDEIEYFYNCFEIYFYKNDFNDLNYRVTEIHRLFKRCVDYFANRREFRGVMVWGMFISLADLLTEANHDILKKYELNNYLALAVKDKTFMRILFDYDDGVKELIEWYEYLIEENYLERLGVSCSVHDLDNLLSIALRNYEELEAFRLKWPLWYIRLVRIFSYFYKRSKGLSYERRSDFRNVTDYLMLSRINVSKATSDSNEISKSIYDYQNTIASEKRSRTLNAFLNTFMGYGEKPGRLLYLYLILQVVVTLCLYQYWDNKHFTGSHGEGFFEKVLDILYFSMTVTMVGFADIAPTDLMVKYIVLLPEIGGFLITGSFVALILRKWFRF